MLTDAGPLIALIDADFHIYRLKGRRRFEVVPD